MKSILMILFVCIINGSDEQEKVDYSYPPLVLGSSWGNVFQRFYINADFDSMLKLTSAESIKMFGQTAVRKQYEKMQFGYQLRLKSWKQDNGYYILSYEANIYATKNIIRMVLTKADTCKIVLPINFLNQNIFLYQ